MKSSMRRTSSPCAEAEQRPPENVVVTWIAEGNRPRTSMPSTYIVDKDGVIRFVHQGYHDGEEAEIEREVRSLL